jgi:hypothetical protein
MHRLYSGVAGVMAISRFTVHCSRFTGFGRSISGGLSYIGGTLSRLVAPFCKAARSSESGIFQLEWFAKPPSKNYFRTTDVLYASRV